MQVFAMTSQRRLNAAFSIAFFISGCAGSMAAQAAQPDPTAIVERLDAAVKARVDGILSYTVTEHYAVFRNGDEVRPVAEMTVETVYQKDSGKSYTILSQQGSQIIRSVVLGGILDNEKRINQPGVREGSWITSANYDFKLKPGGTQLVNGRECFLLAMTPRRKAPYLIEGTLWVDATDGSIVQLQGTSSKSSSFLTGPTQVMRQYARVDGFSQATHARAESDSSLFGRTVVKIDYEGYQIQLRPPQ
jgi:outer membrane lipoprotein-sorting protein